MLRLVILSESLISVPEILMELQGKFANAGACQRVWIPSQLLINNPVFIIIYIIIT